MAPGSSPPHALDPLARAHDEFTAQPFTRYLGAYIRDIGDGPLDIGVNVESALTQQHGYVHAGALASLMDTACGFAALTTVPHDRTVLTAEFKINLLRPALGSRVLVRAEVVKRGRSLVICQANAVTTFDDDAVEPWCALMTATLASIEPPATHGVVGGRNGHSSPSEGS
jgi:uncharacterized protein (TIGR00369 family)